MKKKKISPKKGKSEPVKETPVQKPILVLSKGLDLSLCVDHPKDFHFYKIFGATPLAEIPSTDFYTGHPLKIKNQGRYNFCPAFAKDAVMEDETNIELDPLYSYATACELIGSVQPNGMALRDICNQEVKIGAIEASLAVYNVDSGMAPEFLADWKNYPDSLKAVAWEHERPTYTRVDTGPYDIFDNIRSALYQSVLAGDHKSVLTGVNWRQSWNTMKQGIIKDGSYDVNEPGDGHAVKFFGQINIENIAGEEFLVLQNSWGDEVGDKGLFYFDRGTVNREFVYGAFNFPNIPSKKAEFHSTNNVPITAGLGQKAIAVFVSVIKSWLPKLWQ